MTHPGGRPPFYSKPEELQALIDNYFKTALKGEYTITGLALALGLKSRQAIINYQDKPEFTDMIVEAKLRIEQDYEESLRKHGRSGEIFGLKNFGWRDSQDVNMGGQPDNPQTITVKFV